MAEITTPSKKNTFSKSINRRSTRVDLTPMVDLGFLLITFFVFTTTMNKPKAMNLTEPMDGVTTPVKQSGAMTILLGNDHQIYYYYGILKQQQSSIQILKTDFKQIRELMLNKKKQTALVDLMYIIKPAENSTFRDSIDLLDEMSICDIPQGHYTEVDITKIESDFIKHRE